MAARVLIINIGAASSIFGFTWAFYYFKEGKYKSLYNSINNKSKYLRLVHQQTALDYHKILDYEPQFIKDERKRLIQTAQGNVLEVGIGTGANIPYLDFPKITKYVGID